MNQNTYAHMPYYNPPHVSIGQGYVPLPHAGVGSGMLSMPAPLEIPPQITGWQGWQSPAFFGSAMPHDTPLATRWAIPRQHQAFEQRQPQDAIVHPYAAPLAQMLLLHLGQHDGRAPVQLSHDDERILVQALKAGLAEGLTPRQIVDRLQATNDDAGIGWKNIFLDNVERLYPQVFSYRMNPRSSGPSPSASQTQSSSSFTSSPNRSDIFRPYERQSNENISRETYRKCARARARAGRYTPKEPIPASSAASTSPRRRGTLLEYHGNTLIPPSKTSRKPKAPSSPCRGQAFRFTDDDKVFFIHFLRWRLREGDVPERSLLYQELADETPHHDAEAWRKHWDSSPSLPDRIYIEARKRADNERALARSDADSSEGEDAGRDRVFEDEAPPSRGLGRPAITRLNRRVTEEDLRKMADFLVEKRQSLHIQGKSELWREFYRRQENKERRTYNGWRAAARNYDSQIQQYVSEITAAPAESASKEREVDKETRLTENEEDSPSRSVSTTPSRFGHIQEVTDLPDLPSLKRSMSGSEGESIEDRDEKRVKVEMIDLTD